MQRGFYYNDKQERRSPYNYYLVIISNSFDVIADGAIKLTVGLEQKWINPLFDWTKKSTEIIYLRQRSL